MKKKLKSLCKKGPRKKDDYFWRKWFPHNFLMAIPHKSWPIKILLEFSLLVFSLKFYTLEWVHSEHKYLALKNMLKDTWLA